MSMEEDADIDAFYANHPWPWSDIRGIGAQTTTGTWHSYEQYVKFSNTPGKGIFRFWQDGNLIFEDKVTPTLGVSAQADFIYLFTYWNGDAPKSQSAYVDDIVITSATPNNHDAAGNPFIGL
jgi:hypothetical protein